MSIYEQDLVLSQYLDLHYGQAEQILPWPFGPSSAVNHQNQWILPVIVGPKHVGFDLNAVNLSYDEISLRSDRTGNLIP